MLSVQLGSHFGPPDTSGVKSVSKFEIYLAGFRRILEIFQKVVMGPEMTGNLICTFFKYPEFKLSFYALKPGPNGDQ